MMRAREGATVDGGRSPSRRMGIYDYLYGYGFLVPRVHTRLIAEHLRFARRTGFTDYFAELYPNWGLDGPMPWLVAQLLQDPEQSPEVLLEEYYRRNFGRAAVVMRRYFARCEWQWMTQAGRAYWIKHYRNNSQAGLFPVEVCRELRDLLDEAAVLAAGDEKARERVRFVSDAFGVTERFVAMHDARERLSRMALSREDQNWRDMAETVQRFLAARTELVTHVERLTVERPAAVSKIRWEDYLRYDPTAQAVMDIYREARRRGEKDEAEARLRRIEVPDEGVDIVAWWQAAETLSGEKAGERRSIVRNGGMQGEIRPHRRIAGLDFEVPLPAPWLSYVEPAEFQRAELRPDGDPAEGGESIETQVLRLTGNKESRLYQWNRAVAGAVHVARLQVRGSLSPGTVVSLALDWLDASHQRLGGQNMLLPEGEWPEWVTLQLAKSPPPNAVWVGIGLRIQNQMTGDWAEAKGFEVEAVGGEGLKR